MPQGDKDKYTDKQKRKAEHIAEGYEDRGVSAKEAKSRAWATVNKDSGGGNKSGSGRGRKESPESARKGLHGAKLFGRVHLIERERYFGTGFHRRHRHAEGGSPQG